MIAGLIATLGRGVGALKNGSKIALGLNPNQPFELRSWLGQFFQPGGGMGAARSEGAAGNQQAALMDRIANSNVQRYVPPARTS